MASDSPDNLSNGPTKFERARRMLDLADDYRRGAEILSKRILPLDASQTLLSIIEFEILLKSAVYLETEIKKFDHEYAKIWNKLPKNRRDELLKAANERCAGHVDLPETDDALIDRLLSDLQIMFQKGRYLYEFNDHRSDEDAHNVGNNWIAGGARIEDADIRFRPMELFALSFALRQFCESKLEVASNTEPNLSSQSPTVKPLRNDG